MLTALLLSVAMNAPAPTTAAKTTVTSTEPAPQTFLPVDDKSYGPLIQDAHKGKFLLVNFWASYCGPCLIEIPELLVFAEKHKATVDVVFVATDDPAPDSSAHAASILARRKIALPGSYIVSNAEPRAFITRVDKDWHGEMPTTVLYGPDGTKLKVLIAAHSPAEFEAELAAAVAATSTPR